MYLLARWDGADKAANRDVRKRAEARLLEVPGRRTIPKCSVNYTRREKKAAPATQPEIGGTWYVVAGEVESPGYGLFSQRNRSRRSERPVAASAARRHRGKMICASPL